MADDVLLNKAASIERCVRRARDWSMSATRRVLLRTFPAKMQPF